jgi:tetratricopeptide (TPR) repeat protein
MLSEDYIIRMIQLAVAALLRIAGLRKSGHYQDALNLIDLTMEQLVGLRASRIKGLEDERLYFLLTRNERLDTQRLGVIADLFHQEGEIYAAQQRLEESQASYARALKYLLEVFFQEEETGREEVQPRIEALLEKVKPEILGADVQWPLAGYQEAAGRYAAAEALLLKLAEQPEARSELLPELADFYERLLEETAQDLRLGGMDPLEVRARLEHLRRPGA